jgi:hypothetical protein
LKKLNTSLFGHPLVTQNNMNFLGIQYFTTLLSGFGGKNVENPAEGSFERINVIRFVINI